TLELLKPVHVAPLSVTAKVIRPGRTVQLAEVEVVADDVLVARGRVLRIRRDEGATAKAAETSAIAPPPLPAPGGPEFRFHDQEWTAFHNTGVEHSFVAGNLEVGPATDWIRLRVPLVPDEVPTPFQRVAAAADF